MSTPAPPAPAAAPAAATTPPSNPLELLRSRNYVGLLVLGAIIGAPIAAVAFAFLKAVTEAQNWIFTTLPHHVGFSSEPTWWPILPLALAGLIVGLTIKHLPGNGGHEPSEGFKPAGAITGRELPGIIIAAFATLALGAVLGPEAPLIAIGAGVALLIVHLIKRDAPATATLVVGAAGSFAAVSALLGSPIVGAFLLMEVAGLGGPILGVVLVPGLLASGVGTLIFILLYTWTDSAPVTLAIPDIPPFGNPTFWEFLWAIAIGVIAAVLGALIKRASVALKSVIERRRVLLTIVAAVVVALLAVFFGEVTDKGTSPVLFSGELALPVLIQQASTWAAGTLVLLVLCKGLAYCVSLSCFRGGPTFPAMFIGAAGGIALGHLPGLPVIAGAAMGIGAMTVAVLGLPLTSVLLASLFLESDAFTLMPLVIVAVVVAYVGSARLAPRPPRITSTPVPAAEPAVTGEPAPAGAGD
jgi:H+/Cl- antiporter ClcA